ncbi:MAG: hypothetical protein IT357_00440 [Gemmatimonadaceae bacterium]|nr:hypothetical protein [Gemmatimonadaceae bacterium]
MRSPRLLAALAAVFAGVAVANFAPSAPPPSALTDATRLIGTPVPEMQLRTLAGDSVSVGASRDGKPPLRIITKASDGASCARFAFEVRLLRQKLPQIRIFLVGSGPEEPGFRSYFAEERMQDHALLDPDRAPVAALGLQSEPAVLFTDGEGNVLLVDTRTPAGRLCSRSAASFPLFPAV